MEITDWPQMGIGGVVAAMIFFFYRKDVSRYTDLWKGQSEMMIQVVKENTAAITRLIERMDKD